MLDGKLALTGVEIAHFTGVQISGADRQPSPAGIELGNVDELAQGLGKRLCRIIAGPICRQRDVYSKKRERVGAEEP